MARNEQEALSKAKTQYGEVSNWGGGGKAKTQYGEVSNLGGEVRPRRSVGR